MSKPGIEELSCRLSHGDVLIAIPPTAKAEIPSLGAHLLQSCCRREKITVRVLYANLYFSHLIGFNNHYAIAELNSTNFIGERLFAASAFGLPPMGRNIHRLIDPTWLPDHLWLKKNEIASRKMSENLAPIRRWALSIDWQHVEAQAAQWTVSAADQIARMGYRVVGCSNTLGGLVPAIALLKQVKQADPDIITVLGGAHCEGKMAEGISSLGCGIDYVFSGESEHTFPAFVKDALAGRLPEEKIIYGREVEDMDNLPLPDYREFFQQAESMSLKPPSGESFPITYETSRGCRWNKCAFCGLNGEKKSYFIKSPDNVFRDIEQLGNQYPGSPIHMADNVVPLQYFETLFPRMSEGFPTVSLQYTVNAGLTCEQVMALKQAGVTNIIPGIESLSPRLLKRMRKNGTVRQNIALLRYVRSVGISAQYHLLFGIPGDQLREYEEMVELLPQIHHLHPPVRLLPVELPRFSLYQTEPETFGISNLQPAELYKDVLPSNADLEKIAYFFSGDFESQAYEHPDILAALRKEFKAWINAWQTGRADRTNASPPRLHLERSSESKSPGGFVLHDTRGLPGKPEIMEVDRRKAGILLTARPWDDSPELQWAVDAELGIVKESWFIPFATSDPYLLLEFEREQNNNRVSNKTS